MFQTVRFIQIMSLTFGLFTQVSGSGPLGPLVVYCHEVLYFHVQSVKISILLSISNDTSIPFLQILPSISHETTVSSFQLFYGVFQFEIH